MSNIESRIHDDKMNRLRAVGETKRCRFCHKMGFLPLDMLF